MVDNTKELKRRLLEKFDEKIGFFPSVKQLIVSSIEVNPCRYSVATLGGFGLSGKHDHLLEWLDENYKHVIS